MNEDPLDDADLDVMARLRAGTGSIRARPDALGAVHHQVTHRRRHRRRVAGGVIAAVAVVAVAVPFGVTALVRDTGDPAPAVDPTEVPTATPTETGQRPAAFFVSLLGGRARGGIIDYSVPGVRFYARFDWTDQVAGDRIDPGAVQAGAAVEPYDGTPEEACDALAAAAPDVVGDLSACAPVAEGRFAYTFERSAADVVLAPFHDTGELADVEEDDRVVGATVLREDGLAVTLTVCDCTRTGDPGSDIALTPADLVTAAAAEGWVLRR